MNCSVSPLRLVPLLLSGLAGCASSPERPTAVSTAARSGAEVRGVDGLGLFSDERRKSQVLLAEALAKRGVAVAPVETVERAWALAAEGRSPVTGASCGRPLSDWEARRRWGPELGLTGTVGSYVSCDDDGGCLLEVSGASLEGGRPEFSLEAPFPSGGEALAALTEALPRLAPPPPESASGVGGLLGGLGSSGVQTQDLLRQHVWSADSRQRSDGKESDAFPSLTVTQVSVCLAPGSSSVGVLVEVGPDGRVTRCEGSSVHERSAAPCACGQLERATKATWLRGKRWSVTLTVDRADQLSADQQLVINAYWNTHLVKQQRPGAEFPNFVERIEDPSLRGWSPGSTRQVTECFAGAFEKPGRLSSRWAVWFDGLGRVTKVQEQKGWPWLRKDVGACVVRTLLMATTPCPARAGLWAMVDLHANARDPKAPVKPLGGLLDATDGGVP